jgi:sugar O-acyltransferase (sialic acid O-acetyltransferase NeuD family)
MKDIILIGDGGHCHACIDVIESSGTYRIKGVVAKEKSSRTHVLQYPIIGCDAELPELLRHTPYAIVTVGQIKSPAVRMKLFSLIKGNGGYLASVIADSAYVSKHAEVGEGTAIMHNAFVNAGATIGANCIINTGAIIEHDVHIGAHCHIATNATVNGGCVVEPECFIGSGAVIREGVHVGRNSIIGAGVTVLENVVENSMVRES